MVLFSEVGPLGIQDAGAGFHDFVNQLHWSYCTGGDWVRLPLLGLDDVSADVTAPTGLPGGGAFWAGGSGEACTACTRGILRTRAAGKG